MRLVEAGDHMGSPLRGTKFSPGTLLCQSRKLTVRDLERLYMNLVTLSLHSCESDTVECMN